MKACAACGSARCDGQWKCEDCGFAPSVVRGFAAFAPDLAFESVGFDPGHFEGLAGLEDGSFWFRARNQLVMWAARRYFPSSRTVHEAGCGTGYVLSALRRALPDATVSGSDVLVEGLEIARSRHPDIKLLQVDVARMPFVEEFDLVGAFDVIEHLDDDLGALRMFHRALRPGGGLLLTVPQHPALWSAQDERASHRRRYVAKQLARRLESAGFRLRRMSSFVSLLLPAMMLARLRERAPEERDGVDALTVSAPIDALLRPVMLLERRLIEAGLSFPAGGSLLVAAERDQAP